MLEHVKAKDIDITQNKDIDITQNIAVFQIDSIFKYYKNLVPDNPHILMPSIYM